MTLTIMTRKPNQKQKNNKRHSNKITPMEDTRNIRGVKTPKSNSKPTTNGSE